MKTRIPSAARCLPSSSSQSRLFTRRLGTRRSAELRGGRSAAPQTERPAAAATHSDRFVTARNYAAGKEDRIVCSKLRREAASILGKKRRNRLKKTERPNPNKPFCKRSATKKQPPGPPRAYRAVPIRAVRSEPLRATRPRSAALIAGGPPAPRTGRDRREQPSFRSSATP